MLLKLLLFAVISWGQVRGPVNIGALEIPKPEAYARVIAIGDVAGQQANLFNLLLTNGLISREGLWLGGKSLMILTGNIIGLGPSNIYVLDFLINLTQQADLAGGKIIVLMGSEEQKLLLDPDKYQNPSLEKEFKDRQMTMAQFLNPLYPRGLFLRMLPAAALVGRWLFMQTGRYPEVPWPQFQRVTSQLLTFGQYSNELLNGPQSIFGVTDWWKNDGFKASLKQSLFRNGFFGLVFGGANETFNAPGELAMSDEQRLIKINTGMAPDKGSSPGRLLVFTLPPQMNILAPAKVVSIAPGFIVKPMN